MNVTDWRAPCIVESYCQSHVHVWRVPTRCGADEIDGFRELLTPDEAARADRFRFDRDRSSFVVRRGVLRLLLGRYLEANRSGAQSAVSCPAPGGGGAIQRAFILPFDVNAYGRPLMPAGATGCNLCFSVSHSRDLALLAFAWDRQVGVDIEAVRSDVDVVGVAARFFSERERRALLALPAEQQRDAFFACWSRKEAYIKARGMGLSLSLDTFDVSLSPGEPAHLLATRDDLAEAARWSMLALDAGPDYAAALAVERGDCELRRWEWAAPT